jgi:hypothetical protein
MLTHVMPLAKRIIRNVLMCRYPRNGKKEKKKPKTKKQFNCQRPWDQVRYFQASYTFMISFSTRHQGSWWLFLLLRKPILRGDDYCNIRLLFLSAIARKRQQEDRLKTAVRNSYYSLKNVVFGFAQVQTRTRLEIQLRLQNERGVTGQRWSNCL